MNIFRLARYKELLSRIGFLTYLFSRFDFKNSQSQETIKDHYVRAATGNDLTFFIKCSSKDMYDHFSEKFI